MTSFFKELFAYSHHCNQQLAEVFVKHPDTTSEKAISLFSHILNAHHIWNNRIDPQQAAYGVWQLQDAKDFKQIDQANYKHSLHILDTFDLDATINYNNSKGQSFQNSIQDVLFHSINHSTYHRGQIATDFKTTGLQPLVTDFIFYKREYL
jgi:uncharacterized damage-inducible protein DinB